jgi:hypothetical protein
MKLRQQERRAGVGAPLCRLRNKGTYLDEVEAVAAVAAKSAAYGRPLWPYECDKCGSWHLTSHRRGRALPVPDVAAMAALLAGKLNTRP